MCLYLVVVREGDDGGTDSQDHGRVDLTVCVGGAIGHTLFLEVIRGHGEHHSLLLQSVNVLHHATCHQVLPANRQTNKQTNINSTSRLWLRRQSGGLIYNSF